MTTKEEDQKDMPENAENPEEQKEEEEEPVDVELQKEMKGLKIEDSDFTNEPKVKKSNKKVKNSDVKKSKKKGEDFLDYANKNNIEIKIEYEENKFQLKKKTIQKMAKRVEIHLMIIKDNITEADTKMIKIIHKNVCLNIPVINSITMAKDTNHNLIITSDRHQL